MNEKSTTKPEILRFIEDEDTYEIDILELKIVRKKIWDFKHQVAEDIQKIEVVESLQGFFDWYLNYCSQIIKEKTYSDKDICNYIFNDIKTEYQYREYLRRNIYISRDYILHLKDSINIDNIQRYQNTLSTLFIDLEELIIQFEIYSNKTIDSVKRTSWRKRILDPLEIYAATNTLFHIEEFDNIEDMWLGKLKPLVMFQIRQLLEMFGKQLIGFTNLMDKNNHPLKKFTQIAWDFIKEETKKEDSRIELPFDIDMILFINKWANSFVHTTFIDSSYIQFFVLNALEVLFQSQRNGIKVYTGQVSRNLTISDIKIKNYNALKKDFEAFLKEKNNDSPVIVDWLPTNEVGAYILSSDDFDVDEFVEDIYERRKESGEISAKKIDELFEDI